MKPLSTVSWLLFTIWKKGYNTLTLYNAIRGKLYLNASVQCSFSKFQNSLHISESRSCFVSEMVPFSETVPVLFPYCTPVLYLRIRIGKIDLDSSYQRYFRQCSQLLSFAYIRCPSVVDSHRFQCGSESIILGQSGSGSSSGSGVLATIFYIYSFTAKKPFLKNCIGIFLSLLAFTKGAKLQKSVQPSKENIQHSETWHFFTVILFLWVILSLLDPDPADQKHQNQCLFSTIRSINCNL